MHIESRYSQLQMWLYSVSALATYRTAAFPIDYISTHWATPHAPPSRGCGLNSSGCCVCCAHCACCRRGDTAQGEVVPLHWKSVVGPGAAERPGAVHGGAWGRPHGVPLSCISLMCNLLFKVSLLSTTRIDPKVDTHLLIVGFRFKSGKAQSSKDLHVSTKKT